MPGRSGLVPNVIHVPIGEDEPRIVTEVGPLHPGSHIHQNVDRRTAARAGENGLDARSTGLPPNAVPVALILRVPLQDERGGAVRIEIANPGLRSLPARA